MPDSLLLLENMYNEHHILFTFIKASLLKLVKDTYKLYVESHIKHTITVYPDHPLYKTLRQLHYQYKNTNAPITFDIVQSTIYNLDKNIIKKLLGWVSNF